MKFTAVYEPASEGGFVAWLEEMPNVQTQGETLAEAKENLQDAFRLSMEFLRDKANEKQTPDSVREPFEVTS